MILAALEKPQEEVSDDDFVEILERARHQAAPAAPHGPLPQHPALSPS
jgi:hypothetical protein